MITNEDQDKSIEALAVLHGDCTIRVEEAPGSTKYLQVTVVERVEERPGLYLGHYRLFEDGKVRDVVNEETLTAEQLQAKAFEPEVFSGYSFRGMRDENSDPIAAYDGFSEDD